MDRLLVKYRRSPVDVENWLDSLGCRVLNAHYQIDIIVVQVPPSIVVDDLVEQLRQRPDVLYVESDAVLDSKVLSTGTDPMAFRNDAIFEAMRIAEAHAVTSGREDCVIGVMDSGLDITNPDFTGRVVTGMIFDRGVDRRAGNYPFAVDIRAVFSYPSSYNLAGYNVIALVNRFDTFPGDDQYAAIYGNEALTVRLPNPYVIPSGSDCIIWITADVDLTLQTPAQIGTMGGVEYGDVGLSVMKDHLGHGTGCAGVIVANPENDFGVRGIAPRCKVQPLKVFDPYGYLYISSLVAAFMYVGNNLWGVNCSFGMPDAQWTQAIADAVQFATQRSLVVVASGNSSTQDPFHAITTYDTAPWPGASPGVISVSGTCYRNNYHMVAQFAQRYANVSICAPATNWALSSPRNFTNYYGDWKAGVTLEAEAGTSFASPASAAVIAGLMISAAMDTGVNVSDLATRQALIARIKTALAESASVKPVTAYNGGSVVGVGAGLIDAARAVRAIAQLPDLLITATGKAVVGVSTPVDVDAKTWGNGFYKLLVYEDGVLIDTLSLDTAVHHATYSYTPQSAGEKRLAIKAVDKNGASSKKGVKVTVTAVDTPTVALVPLYDIYPDDVYPPTIAQETEAGKYDIFSTGTDGYSLPVVKSDNILRCTLGSHAGAGLTFASMSVYVDGVLNTTKTDLLGYGAVVCQINAVSPGYHTIRVVVTAANGASAETTSKMVYAPDRTAFMETPTVTDGMLYISGFARGVSRHDTGSSLDKVDIGYVDVYLNGTLFHEGYAIKMEEQFFQTAIQLDTGSAPPLVKLHWRFVEVEEFADWTNITSPVLTIDTVAQSVAATKPVTTPESFPVPPTTTAVQQSGRPAKLIADEQATIYYTTDGTEPVQVASVPQGATRVYNSGLAYNQADVADGFITVKYFGVSSGGVEAVNTSVVEPTASPLIFTAQPQATPQPDASVLITYGTADTQAEDSATAADVIASVTDRVVFRDAAAAIVTAGVSVTDARRMVEAITSTAQVTATVTDTVRQVEQLLAQIQAFPTVNDVMELASQVQGPALIFTAQPTFSMTSGDGGIITYGTADTGADDVATTAGADAQVTDTVRRVEAALAAINAMPTVADVVAQVEAVTVAAQAQAEAVDVKLSGIADDLATAAEALTQVSDVQLMVDNVTIMANSGAGLTEILTYVQTVATTITAGASVVDVLRSAVVIRYLLANICAPRRFADTAAPRRFADLCSIRR